MGYRIALIAPNAKPADRDGTWDVEFRDSPGHATVMSLTPDELDDAELELARRRAQLGLPRLTGVVHGISGHRFDSAGDAIGFTEAQLRNYDDGQQPVIVTKYGERFPFDEKVEVIYP